MVTKDVSGKPLGATEDGGGGDGGCFGSSELTAPADASLWVGTLAAVVVFLVADGVLLSGVVIVFPVLPTCANDVLAKVAVHEEGVGVSTPGTTEIDFVNTLVGCQPAVVEDIAVLDVLRCGGGGDVGVDLTAYLATFEPGGGRSEDEVGGAFDIAVFEVQTGVLHAGIYRVLVAEEAAVDELQTVAFGVQSHCLSLSRRIVLDGDVAEGDVAAFNLDRIGAEGAHRLQLLVVGPAYAWYLDVGMVIVGDDGVVAVFSDNLNVGEPRGYDDLLFVDAFLDEDDFLVFHEGAAHLYGGVDGLELAGAVVGYKQGVGVVVLAAGGGFANGHLANDH